jgi:hypothetical protein
VFIFRELSWWYLGSEKCITGGRSANKLVEVLLGCQSLLAVSEKIDTLIHAPHHFNVQLRFHSYALLHCRMDTLLPSYFRTSYTISATYKLIPAHVQGSIHGLLDGGDTGSAINYQIANDRSFSDAQVAA